MRPFHLTFSWAILLVATATVTCAAKQKCNPNASASTTTCTKNQYCLIAKPYNYCTPKLDGGDICEQDKACKGGLCFVAKTKKAKRLCAPTPLSDFPDGSQCTEAKQCASGFCDTDGYCKTLAAQGEKCSKDADCYDTKKGVQCLKKDTTFIIYSSSGTKKTKKLSAGRCSYAMNLGEGMSCSSNVNCYSPKFKCSSKTDKCTAIPITTSATKTSTVKTSTTSTKTTSTKKPANTLLPYQATCASDEACNSGKCNSGRCGCWRGGTDERVMGVYSMDCNGLTEFCDDNAVCQPKHTYAQPCKNKGQCLDRVCGKYVAAGLNRTSEGSLCGCLSDGVCQSTEFCTSSGYFCTTKLDFDEGCYSDNQCISQRCQNGVCTRRPCDDGICLCNYDQDCGSGQFCAGNHCEDHRKGANESCDRDAVCASDMCVNFWGKQTCACNADEQCSGVDEACNLVTNKCEISSGQNLGYGQYCSVDGDCRSWQCIGSYNPQCGCTADDCSSDQYCDETCLYKRPYGADCSTSIQCSSNNCRDDGICGCQSFDDCKYRCDGKECTPDQVTCVMDPDNGLNGVCVLS